MNKANLRDLIAATGLVILLKFDPNHWFFSPCDLEHWWMSLKNNRAPLLYYRLCASFPIHRWIQTEVTVRKPSSGTSSILHRALAIITNPSVNSNWSYSPETHDSGQNRQFFVPCDLEIWRMILKKSRVPLLCCFKFYASSHSHQWIQTRVTVRKRPIWVKIVDLFSRVTLKCDGWLWKTIGHIF